MPRFDEHFDRHLHRAWHKMEAAGRRGWGGWGGGRGGGWGDFGGFGDNLRIGRMLASGDLRLVALYLIEQQPRHGYDLIKAIEEKTNGLYSPSPGVIYPALTYLEEASFVTSTAEGNKRLYTITDEGRSHLNDNREAVESTLAHLARVGEQFEKMRERWAGMREEFHDGPPPPPPHHHPPHPPHHHPHHDHDLHDVDPDVNEARRELKDAIKRAAKDSSIEAQRRLADILRRAAAEIRDGHRPPPPPPHDDVDI